MPNCVLLSCWVWQLVNLKHKLQLKQPCKVFTKHRFCQFKLDLTVCLNHKLPSSKLQQLRLAIECCFRSSFKSISVVAMYTWNHFGVQLVYLANQYGSTTIPNLASSLGLLASDVLKMLASLSFRLSEWYYLSKCLSVLILYFLNKYLL